MFDKFQIAETETFQKVIYKNKDKNLYLKIKNYVYPQLKSNPFFGPNIKKLKGTLENYYRYRIGSHLLFYQVDSDKVIVFIITLKARKDAY